LRRVRDALDEHTIGRGHREHDLLRIADRLLGAEVLREVAEFVRELQLLYSGVQKRARDVYKLLRSPAVGFVVVTTLEPAPFAEAEYFCSKLRQFSMPLRALVVNRVLPDELRDPSALAAATTLDENPNVAPWLTSELGTKVSRDTAQAVGRTYLTFNALAQRDARQLAKLERLGEVPVARIPLFTDDVAELDGLVRIAGLL